MRCSNPRTVGFKDDGRTIAWSQKSFSKEYPTFQLPCGKCLECRLEYARQWAVRCVHESMVHEKNSFVTLTYSDEHLKSPWLQYRDFQLFMKKLRKTQDEPIGVFVTGEYGDKTKRPHWHAILFNYRPSDCRHFRVNDRGDEIFSSDMLDKLWNNGRTEVGSVTFHSAGYCARYAAKKLIHGNDGSHEYLPISKKSSKHAIGKKFLEKFWPDIFSEGIVILPDGKQTTIPRYYEKWLRDTHPDAWIDYVTTTKQKKMTEAALRSHREEIRWWETQDKRDFYKPNLITQVERRKIILRKKFKELQKHLKGDI